jgi:hypothetical protein
MVGGVIFTPLKSIGQLGFIKSGQVSTLADALADDPAGPLALTLFVCTQSGGCANEIAYE